MNMRSGDWTTKTIVLFMIFFFCLSPLGHFQTKEISVIREVLLSDKDIKDMNISKGASGEYRLNI